MFGRLFGIGDAESVDYFECYLRSAWSRLAVLLLVAAALAYVIWIYRRERVISRGRRIVLGVCRGVLYAIILLMLFEPMLGMEMRVRLRRSILVLVDRSESMAMHDRRTGRKQLEEAALALGMVPFDKPSQPLSAKDRAQAANAARIDLAKGILTRSGADVLKELERVHNVRYFTFGERLEPTSGEGEAVADTLRRIEPTAQATRLGAAIEEARQRFGSQPIAGVLVLTDGASNGGVDPLEVARRMREHGIPLFTLGIGVPHPPDLRIESVSVHDTVLLKDTVPVSIQVTSTGYANRTVELALLLDGQRVARTDVLLTDKPEFVALEFTPERQVGTAKLEVTLDELPGESSTDNNRYEKRVRVIDEKIRVLYVEGKPRWEYRYLRRVLLRDESLDVKFLMTEGDRDLAKVHDRYLATFPEEASKAFAIDLVILGDVPADYFTPAQLERMEQLVRERGGSLLMLAGEKHAPASYFDSPIAPVLPVKLHPAGRESVADSMYPVLTEAGEKSTVVALDPDPERNAGLWRLVKPLYSVPALVGKKPAATVLLTLPDAARRTEPYPLVAWHRYGSGKALFVGTDQLWRLRFKRGDIHHLHFWGQAIRFLTLSRLLGENKQIRIETPRRAYRTGEQVQIIANVLTETYEPVAAPTYSVRVERLEPQAGTTELTLEPVKGAAGGLYQGFFTTEAEGRYRIRTGPDDVDRSNEVEFTVATTPLEQLEPAMQEERLKKMAELSGGRYFTVAELPELPDAITQEIRTAVVRRERELWDLPLLFVVLLTCAGTEWFLRRRYDLI